MIDEKDDQLMLEKMTDEQLLEDREIVSVTPATDKTWNVMLSCSHQAIFAIQPYVGSTLKCAQCVELLLIRHKSRIRNAKA